MYSADLSPYINRKGIVEKGVFCVGWLDAEHEFPKGNVAPEILQSLLQHCLKFVNPTRGFHQSPFIPNPPFGFPVQIEGQTILLGSAEIRATAGDGTIYAAPNLVFHYVRDCGYLAPAEFIEALVVQ